MMIKALEVREQEEEECCSSTRLWKPLTTKKAHGFNTLEYTPCAVYYRNN
jgi:hypothetical protein